MTGSRWLVLVSRTYHLISERSIDRYSHAIVLESLTALARQNSVLSKNESQPERKPPDGLQSSVCADEKHQTRHIHKSTYYSLRSPAPVLNFGVKKKSNIVLARQWRHLRCVRRVFVRALLLRKVLLYMHVIQYHSRPRDRFLIFVFTFDDLALYVRTSKKS